MKRQWLRFVFVVAGAATVAASGCGAQGMGTPDLANGTPVTSAPGRLTPTTQGVGGQSGTGDARTTGSSEGYAQATSAAMGGTGGNVGQNRGLTSGSAGATPGVMATTQPAAQPTAAR